MATRRLRCDWVTARTRLGHGCRRVTREVRWEIPASCEEWPGKALTHSDLLPPPLGCPITSHRCCLAHPGRPHGA